MRRPGPPREIPPPLELECLKVLWTLREGNVHEVRQVLSERRSLAYTTVMTLLERLVRKGGVSRRKVGRSFVYAPLLDRDCLRRAAVKELIESFFDSSPEALTAYLQNGVSGSSAAAAAASDNGYTAPLTSDRLDPALL
ncbi:MAG: BlaI/MecI/CopY family transcriptional regulator [Bryobacteraceae bacterium]